MSASQPRASKDLPLGAMPRVQLMPPEFAQRQRATTIRRRLLGAMLLSIVVVSLAYAAAFLYAQTSAANLARAEDRTQELLAQQLQYSEVSTANADIARLDGLVEFVGANDISWKRIVDDLRSRLPAGVALALVTAEAPAPWDPPLTVAGPLRQERVATSSIQITAPTTELVTEFTRALATIPGYADSSIDAITYDGGAVNAVITLNLNSETYESARTSVDEAEETP